MDALFVRVEGRGTDSAAGHHQLLAVAGSARRWNIGVRDLGFGIAGRQNLMHIAVAILALGNVGIASGGRFGVDAMLIRGLLVSVAGGADGLGWRWIVRESFNVRVAVCASEGTVDGRLKLRIVHVQADLLAVLVLCQRWDRYDRPDSLHCSFSRLWAAPWEPPKP